MKRTISAAAAVGAIALLALPFLASAQVYYYSSGNSYGSYNSYGGSYIPASAMPYVQYGNQMAQQYTSQYMPSYSNYSYPSTQYQYQSQTPEYQYQSQSQYQTSYPSYSSYTQPSYTSSYGSYGSSYQNAVGEYTSEPQSVSYPSGTYGAFGTQLCYWSDSTTYEPCGKDPQQWIQDPYTGDWY